MRGLGLGLFPEGSRLAKTLAALAARSQIAGRDGTPVCTRATPRRCVFTGAVLPNDTACYGVFNLPGLGDTRFYLAEPTSTNREPYSDLRASDWVGSGSIKSTNGMYARFTEDLNNSSHRTTSSSTFTITGSSTYTFSFVVGPATTAPIVTATFGTAWSPTRIVATANLSTGAIGGGVSGGVFPLADGSKLISFTFNSVAVPTANNIPIGMSLTGSETYVGVGNFMDVKDVQLEAAFVPGARIDTSGASVTHNADLLEWTPTTPLGSDCFVWGIYIPFGWRAALNGTRLGTIPFRHISADADAWRLYQTTVINAERRDAGSVARLAGDTTLEAREHAVGSFFGHETVGQYVLADHGSRRSAGSPAGTLPWPGVSSITLGNRQPGGDRCSNSVMCVGVATALTAVERAALHAVSKTLANKFII